MAGFLSKYPGFLCASPPDYLDAEGRPILESGSRRFQLTSEQSLLTRLSYSGARSKANLVSNLGALTHVNKNRSMWRSAARAYAVLVEPMSLSSSVDEELIYIYMLSHCFQCAPFVSTKDSAGRIPLDVGIAFRFFRGIHFYCHHRILFSSGDPRSHTTYLEGGALLVGEKESCPASDAVIESAFDELRVICSSINGSECIEGSSFTSELLCRARDVAELVNLFQCLIATYAARCMSTNGGKLARAESYPLLPVPMFLAARGAARNGGVSAFQCGLARLLPRGETRFPESLEARRLLGCVEPLSSTTALEDILQCARATNTALKTLLGNHDENSSDDDFCQVVQTVLFPPAKST